MQNATQLKDRQLDTHSTISDPTAKQRQNVLSSSFILVSERKTSSILSGLIKTFKK